MRATSWMGAVVASVILQGLAGCSYAYRNPAEALGPGEVGGRTVAGAELLIDGVAVSVQGAALDATSRQNGRFTMLPLPVGRHSLMFRKGKGRALQRDIEIAYGRDGQPQGLWLGDVQVPASVSLAGECAGPPGVTLAADGIAVDEVSGAIVPIAGGAAGGFLFEGLSVGPHRVRVFVSDLSGAPYVGGPAEVTLLASDAGTQKTLTPVTLHRASAAPADTGLVKLRFSVAGTLPGLRLSDLKVTGLPGTVGFASDGTAQLDLPEGIYTVEIALPAGLTGVTAPPRKTFVAVQGQTLDLGTLYAVTDPAQAQAASSCQTDADCAPGSCGAGHVCTGYTPPPQAPASVPWCDPYSMGCSPTGPYGGVNQGPPYTATCAGYGDGAGTAAVACGACCTPNGLDVVCGDAGVGGCAGAAASLVISPMTATSDANCGLPSVAFTASGGTPPYTWTRDVGGLYVDPSTTTARYDACDYTITPGDYKVTVTDSGLPPQSRTAIVTIPDTTSPSLLSVSPPGAAIGVPVASVITATFNEPLLPSSVDGATVTVSVGGVGIAGAVALDIAGTTITFTPTAALPVGATVTVALSPVISDLAGNSAFPSSPFMWTFTIAAAAAAADSWTATSTTGAPLTTIASAVWTGTQLVVWGGTVTGVPANTGARYDPSTGTWTAVSMAGAPAARVSPSAVWTGNELIVWGGLDVNYAPINSGGRYDPATDTWTPMSAIGAPSARYGALPVWTGTQMLVWGGAISGTTTTNTGARYDPATDTWTPVTSDGAPTARFYGHATWTGTEMIIWGGDSGNGYLNDGGRYNPATDRWTPTATTGAPVPIANFTVVWTGTELIVWGGENQSYVAQGTGGRYSPLTDSWTAVSTTGAPTARKYHTAVWTGSEMIVWGGGNGTTVVDTGARYDPVGDSWTATAVTAAPTARDNHGAAWTGTAMLVWGGTDQAGQPLGTGGLYTP